MKFVVIEDFVADDGGYTTVYDTFAQAKATYDAIVAARPYSTVRLYILIEEHVG